MSSGTSSDDDESFSHFNDDILVTMVDDLKDSLCDLADDLKDSLCDLAFKERIRVRELERKYVSKVCQELAIHPSELEILEDMWEGSQFEGAWFDNSKNEKGGAKNIDNHKDGDNSKNEAGGAKNNNNKKDGETK